MEAKIEAKNTQTLGDKIRAYAAHPFSGLMAFLILLASLITFCVLIFLVVFIIIRGVRYITPDLFAFTYTTENASLMPALINTLIMTALSLVIAVPVGICSAVFLVEYAARGSKLVSVIRLTTETLSEFHLLSMVCLVCCFFPQHWDGDSHCYPVH